MINRTIYVISFVGLFLMQNFAYSTPKIESLDMSSPHAFVSSIETEITKEQIPTVKYECSTIGEELEWYAIEETDKHKKAVAYIYSFFLNRESYDMEHFLSKRGVLTGKIPAYTDYIFYNQLEKDKVDVILEQQINILYNSIK